MLFLYLIIIIFYVLLLLSSLLVLYCTANDGGIFTSLRDAFCKASRDNVSCKSFCGMSMCSCIEGKFPLIVDCGNDQSSDLQSRYSHLSNFRATECLDLHLQRNM